MRSEEWRNHPHYQFDPLAEEIGPALLNSVDIKKYVDKGCLIEEVNFSLDRLKTASYEMRFLGKLYDWKTTREGRLEPSCREIREGHEIELSRNSITYLWMKEKLLLPEYIAARFNLHIRHVHRGILLGTGPLVDPGFYGSLLVPLHNLTDNDYKLKGGEGVIWIEFTKVSKNVFWLKDEEEKERPDCLMSLSEDKDRDNPERYFNKSDVTKAGGVQSAFKGALDKSEHAAEAARKETMRFRTIYTWGGIPSAIAIVIAVGSMIFGGYSLVSQTAKVALEGYRHIELHRDVHDQNTDAIGRKIAELEIRIDEYSAEIEVLKRELDLMNGGRGAGRTLTR